MVEAEEEQRKINSEEWMGHSVWGFVDYDKAFGFYFECIWKLLKYFHQGNDKSQRRVDHLGMLFVKC